MHGYPIVYQDVMRVTIAGPKGKPSVGINHRNESDVPLILTIQEAEELAKALRWALDEYAEYMGRASFFPVGKR